MSAEQVAASVVEVERDAALERLRTTMATITELISACGPPDVANGYDRCPCGTGEVWPCSTTRAAWLARGLDPDAEVSRTMRVIRNEMISADWR